MKRSTLFNRTLLILVIGVAVKRSTCISLFNRTVLILFIGVAVKRSTCLFYSIAIDHHSTYYQVPARKPTRHRRPEIRRASAGRKPTLPLKCRPENRHATGGQKSAEQMPAENRHCHSNAGRKPTLAATQMPGRKPTLPPKCRPENRHAIGGQKSAEQVPGRKPTLPLKCRPENRHAIEGHKSAEQVPARKPTHLWRPEVGPTENQHAIGGQNLPIKRRLIHRHNPDALPHWPPMNMSGSSTQPPVEKNEIRGRRENENEERRLS